MWGRWNTLHKQQQQQQKEVLIHFISVSLSCRLKGACTERRLDCRLEMRTDDAQEVQAFWADRGQIFAALNVRDRFRSGGVDRFLFVFDACDDEEDPSPLQQISLSGGVSEIAFTSKRLAVRYYSGDYDAKLEVFDRKDDFDKVELAELPEMHLPVALLSRGDSLYLVFQEGAGDDFLMVHELVDGEDSFEEHCLIEGVPSAVGVRCFADENMLFIWSSEGDFVACHDLSSGDKVWRQDFTNPDRRIVCEEKMASRSGSAAACFVPKNSSDANSLVVLYNGESGGKEEYSVECPADLQLSSWQSALSDRLLLVAHKDEFSGDAVVKIFQRQDKILLTLEHDSSFLLSSMSLAPGPSDVAIVTLGEGQNSGLLSILDLSKATSGKELFESRRDLGTVLVKANAAGRSQKYAVSLIEGGDSTSRLVSQRKTRRGRDNEEDAAVTMVDFEALRFSSPLSGGEG